MSGETTEKSIWEKFTDTMKRELNDLSYIEIVTAEEIQRARLTLIMMPVI